MIYSCVTICSRIREIKVITVSNRQKATAGYTFALQSKAELGFNWFWLHSIPFHCLGKI